MNIFKKIAIFNKVSKIIKEVKKYFDSTTVDDEIKQIITDLINDFKRLISKIPEIKEAVEYLIDLVKNAK
jgi:non-homologous end joining protein Ku